MNAEHVQIALKCQFIRNDRFYFTRPKTGVFTGIFVGRNKVVHFILNNDDSIEGDV